MPYPVCGRYYVRRVQYASSSWTSCTISDCKKDKCPRLPLRIWRLRNLQNDMSVCLHGEVGGLMRPTSKKFILGDGLPWRHSCTPHVCRTHLPCGTSQSYLCNLPSGSRSQSSSRATSATSYTSGYCACSHGRVAIPHHRYTQMRTALTSRCSSLPGTRKISF